MTTPDPTPPAQHPPATTPAAGSMSRSHQPPPPWGAPYQRRVWPLGPTGTDLIIDGVDRRSWAALSCYRREAAGWRHPRVPHHTWRPRRTTTARVVFRVYRPQAGYLAWAARPRDPDALDVLRCDLTLTLLHHLVRWHTDRGTRPDLTRLPPRRPAPHTPTGPPPPPSDPPAPTTSPAP